MSPEKKNSITDGIGLKEKTPSLRQSQIDQNIAVTLVFNYVWFSCKAKLMIL